MKLAWQAVVAEPDQLGESPFWHPAEHRLYWVDIPGRALRRLDPASGHVDHWPMPSEPGCIAPVTSGGLMVALRDGVYRAKTWGAALDPLVEFPHHPLTTRANDGKADPTGRFWVGTMYEPRDRKDGKLYAIDFAQHPPLMQTLQGGVTIANGLAWSPDAKTVYWADTPTHTVRRWSWDAASNAMQGEQAFIRFEPKPAGWKPGDSGYGGRPDGAAVDSQGNYWCAMMEGARLVKISPAGELLAEVPLPIRCPTMPCFGDADLKTLYVTSSRLNRPAGELAAMPLSGCVLAARVDVAGLPVNFVSA